MKTETQMKTCSKCRETKPVSEYNTKRSRLDGLQTECRPCNRLSLSLWRASNRARATEYRAENPHSEWEKHYRSRARAYGFDPAVRSFTRDALIARYGNTCFHCGDAWTELDHYPIPVGLGGEHSIENCRPSCMSCNRKNSQAICRARKALTA